MKYPFRTEQIDKSIDYQFEVKEMLERAENYLLEYSWCREIKNSWIFDNLGNKMCVFLFEIENRQSPEDYLLWVMVGDFPSIYLDTFNIKTNKEVVEVYIELGTDWLKCFDLKQPLDECFPFDINPKDIKLVEAFRKRCHLLQELILPNMQELDFSLIYN